MIVTDIGTVTTPWLLDKLNWDQIEHQWRKTDEVKEEPEEDRYLRCAGCQQPITREDQRIAVQGNHEHTCENPHGLVFQIGCFATASGCAQVGLPTEAWSWFRGYDWQIALCKSCGTHLGWRYRCQNSQSGFYGLILERLIAGQGD